MAVFDNDPSEYVDLNTMFPVLNNSTGLTSNQFKKLVENVNFVHNEAGSGGGSNVGLYLHNITYRDGSFGADVISNLYIISTASTAYTTIPTDHTNIIQMYYKNGTWSSSIIVSALFGIDASYNPVVCCNINESIVNVADLTDFTIISDTVSQYR